MFVEVLCVANIPLFELEAVGYRRGSLRLVDTQLREEPKRRPLHAHLVSEALVHYGTLLLTAVGE